MYKKIKKKFFDKFSTDGSFKVQGDIDCVWHFIKNVVIKEVLNEKTKKTNNTTKNIKIEKEMR